MAMVDSVASRNIGRFLSTSMRLRDTKNLITAHGDASTVTILLKKSTEGGPKLIMAPLPILPVFYYFHLVR